MKQITVMFREEPDMQKLLDLLDKIGLVAEDLGLVVDATFEDVDDPIPALDSFIEFVDAPQMTDDDKNDGDFDWLGNFDPT